MIPIKKLGFVLLGALFVLIAGCKGSPPSAIQPSVAQQFNAGLTISNEGYKWMEDKNALSPEEAIQKAPFPIREPQVPFAVTNKAAYVVKTAMHPPFDLVVMTYANAKLGLQLTIGVDNSTKPAANPKAPRGPVLHNGAETWTYTDANKSGLNWRHNGLNYSMLSFKIENGKVVPLYDPSTLVEIANSL